MGEPIVGLLMTTIYLVQRLFSPEINEEIVFGTTEMAVDK